MCQSFIQHINPHNQAENAANGCLRYLIIHLQPSTPQIWDLNWPTMMVLADRLTDSMFHSPKFGLNFNLIFPNSRLAPVEEAGLSLMEPRWLQDVLH